MSEEFDLYDSVRPSWKPPPDVTVSEWADEHGLIPEGASGTGGTVRWRTRPFQRAMLDAFAHPLVRRVLCQKGARVGWTSILQMVIGYWCHHDPRSILVVQPVEEDCKEWSKEVLAPVIEDTPVLAPLFESPDLRADSTVLQKYFLGGSIRLRGAQTGRGFRRITVGGVLLDEIDAYPMSAGDEGDPAKLAEKRAETVWNAVVGIGSTPLLANFSRIEKLVAEASTGFYVLHCPHCGGEHVRLFRQPARPLMVGDVELAVAPLVWPDGRPDEAHWRCPACEEPIEHRHHSDMIEGGYWRGRDWRWTREDGFEFEPSFSGDIGFRIWSGYNATPASTPQAIATEWLGSKDDPERKQIFVNLTLGETYADEGVQPDPFALSKRGEKWDLDCPVAPDFVTVFADVQADRFELETVGWLRDTRESWSIDYTILPANPDEPDAWVDLRELFQRRWETPAGARGADIIGIDCGYRQDDVIMYVRRHGAGRTFPTKGYPGNRAIVETIAARLKRLKSLRFRKDRVQPVLLGVDTAKEYVYRSLTVKVPGPRYCHFPADREESYYAGLTAEKMIRRFVKGTAIREWHKVEERNEPLDCRVGNLALCLMMEQGIVEPMPADAERRQSPPPVARNPTGGFGRPGWGLR